MAKTEFDSQFLQLTDDDFSEISELMRLLRKEKQDRLFVPVAKLQMTYLLSAIEHLESNASPRLNETLRFGRGVAFNIASFTWPGWGDQPDPISDERQNLGLQAADLCVALGERLGEVTPNSLWIQGAHRLNAGQFNKAIESFERAKQLAKNDFFRQMHTAWQTLTRLIENETAKNTRHFEIAVEQMELLDEEQADFYIRQLNTAKFVYSSVDK